MKWILGEDYRNLNREAEDLCDELRHYWSRLKYPNIGNVSRVGKSGTVDALGNGVAAAVDMETELRKKIEELQKLRLAIEKTIDSLPSAERRIMRMRYIRGFTWQQIAQRLYCDESTCRRAHRKIVRELNK